MLELARYLIEQAEKQGIDIPASMVDEKWTPLAMALDNGNYNSPEIIGLLIKEGINKEYYTKALLKSVVCDDLASVQLLIDAGAVIYDWVHFEFDEYVSVELNGKYYYYDRQGKRFEAE